MQRKTLFIGLVMFLFLISSAFAVLNDANSWYTFDDDETSGTTLTDIGSESYDATLVNGITTGVTGWINEQYTFDGTADYLSGAYKPSGFEDFSMVFHFNTDNIASTQGIYQFRNGASGNFIWVSIQSSKLTFQISDGSTRTLQSGVLSSNTDYTGAVTFDSSTDEMILYVDGSNVGSLTPSFGSWMGTSQNGEIGVIRGSQAYEFDGELDEMGFYDRVLSSTEVSDYHALTTNPYESVVSSDERIQQVIEVEQLTPVEINSETYVDIYSTQFSVINNSDAYTSWTIEAEAVNKDMTADCRVLVNGIDYQTQKTRTLSNGDVGVMYLFSQNFSLIANEFNDVTLQCNRGVNSGARLNIIKAEGLVNIMQTVSGTPLNNLFLETNLTLNSTSYQKLAETNFTTSNLTGDNLIISLIADGSIGFEYDADSTISLYATLNGETSPVFERYGASGTNGFGAGLYLVTNITANENVTFALYGKSTSASGTARIKASLVEMFSHDAEATVADLANKTINTGTWATIDTIYVNNSNHPSADILAKVSFSVQSDSGEQTVYYRFKSGTNTSQEYSRTIDTTGAGMAMLQHVFEDKGLTNTSIEFQAYTSANTATITAGGHFGYLAQGLAANPQFYRVTAQDEVNSTAIDTFNVTTDEGTLFQTSSGFVDIYNVNGLNDLNVSAENYQTNITLAHDTTTNLTVNLRPDPLEDFSILTPLNGSETNDTTVSITWNASVSPTGRGVTYNVSTIYDINNSLYENFTTTNLSYLLDISNYPSGDYIISVTAIENQSNYELQKNVSVFVNRPNFLYFYNQQTGEPIEGANITIDLPNYEIDVEQVTDAEGKTFFLSYYNDTLQTGNYSITFRDFIGYVTPITFNREYNTLPINESFDITVTNINISILYRSNFSTFDKNATVIIEGLANYTVSNGSIFIQNATIATGDYRITVSSEGFYNEEKKFTFTGQDDLDLNLYMLKINESNSGTVTIRTVDEFQRLLADAQVNLLEYDVDTLSYIEVSECFTNSNGECEFLVETNTKSYKFTASRTINGVTVTASTSAQIFADDVSGGQTIVFSEETITLTLSTQEVYQLNPLQNIIFDIDETFNNVTNQSNIDVSFQSIDGTNLEVCVEYFEIAGGTKTSLTGNTFCVTASSAEVTENAFFTLNRSKEYVAEVYIKTDNGKVGLQSFRYQSLASFAERLKSNATLPFVVLFIWVFIIAAGMYLKNVPLLGVFITVGAWTLVFFFPSILITSAAVLQTLIGITLIYTGRKKEDFQ